MAKFCPNCGVEVNENADICLNCGKELKASQPSKKGNNNKKKGLPGWGIALIVIGILVVVLPIIGVIIYAALGTEAVKDTINDSFNEVINEDVSGTIGDTLKVDNFELTLENCYYYDSIGDGYYVDEPASGKVYLVFFFEVENTSNEDDYFNYLYFTGYEDGYSVSPTFIINDPEGYELLTGDIAAGMKMKGYIAYEVDENWEEFELNYKTYTSNKATFRVVTDK